MGGWVNIFKSFQGGLSFDNLFNFWQASTALDLWGWLAGLCASCCSRLAFADSSDSGGRKYSPNNPDKAHFHGFLQTQRHYKSKGLTPGKRYAAPLLSDALEYALCPPGGKRVVAVWKKNAQENTMHSFSRAVVTHLPFEHHALRWLKLKAQIEATLSKHFSGIFFISSYHYTHNPSFTHHDFFHRWGRWGNLSELKSMQRYL